MKHIENIVYPYRKAEILIDYMIPDTPSDVTLVLGHGRYNDLNQPLLKYLSKVLPEEKVNLVRFNYPFVEHNRPFISHRKCLIAYRAVLDDIKSELPGTKFLFAGGKSLSAHLAAKLNPPEVMGFVFLSFPLHLPKIRIPISRKKLFELKRPMLFVNGAEDSFCDRGKLELLMGALNPYAHLLLIPETGHSLELQDSQKRTQEEMNKEIADIIVWFISDVIEKRMRN